MAIDQYTYDIVRNIAINTVLNKNFNDVREIRDVKIVGGDLLMGSVVETMPRDMEIKLRSFVNCTNTSRPWIEEKTIETYEKVEISIERELSVSSMEDVNFAIDWKTLKLGGGLKTEDMSKLKQSKHYTSEIKTNEKVSINEMVPPQTALYVKATIKSGFIKAKLEGTVILDAYVLLKHPNEIFRSEGWLSDSRIFSQIPKDKTVAYNGFITSETFSHVEKTIVENPLVDNDPRCSLDGLQIVSPIVIKP